MAIDGILLNSICSNINFIFPCKINKIQQVSDTEILFTLRSNNKNHKLMISCHSNYNRIHLTNRNYNIPDTPSSFLMVLRKHIGNAIIKSMKQKNLDRIIEFQLEARNELGDIHEIQMIVELMGKYANIILVNDEQKIIDALKRIPPFENNIRTIHPGALFTPIAPQQDKKNPFTHSDYHFDTSLTKQFEGFSPLLSDEITYRITHGEKFNEIMNEIQVSDSIYYYEINNKEYFHLIELKQFQSEGKHYPLLEALDTIYYNQEEKVRIKEQNGDLFKFTKQEYNKSKNKLIKLEKTLDDAYNLETYQIYGDLLYAYAYKFDKKEKQVVLPSFEDGTDIVIPLDIKLDIKQNAKKYYQKYSKSKTAQIEVAKQIAKTKQSIQYFEVIIAQLEQASIIDAMEIRDELIKNGYMHKKQKNIRNKKKSKPNFITLKFDDTYIYVGKNNIQNDYITFKQSRKNYTWLHAKDLHGSHVVINEENPSENILRIAAMFAAYYSKGRQSSSVPINYCLIKQLRKPNNAALGFVTLTNYKTIYIDPEETKINEYLIENEIK